MIAIGGHVFEFPLLNFQESDQRKRQEPILDNSHMHCHTEKQAMCDQKSQKIKKRPILENTNIILKFLSAETASILSNICCWDWEGIA